MLVPPTEPGGALERLWREIKLCCSTQRAFVHIHVQLPTTNLNRGQDTRAIAIAARRHNTILARDRAAHDGADCVRACLVHVGTASPGTLQRTSVQPAQTLPPSRHGRRIRTFSRAATPPPQVPPPTPTGRSRFLTQQHRAQPPHARALPSSPLAARPRRTRPSCAARAGESGARPYARPHPARLAMQHDFLLLLLEIRPGGPKTRGFLKESSNIYSGLIALTARACRRCCRGTSLAPRARHKPP